MSWNKICCAIDFSDYSRAALDQAIVLACQNGAELVLVHVFRPPATVMATEPLFLAPQVMLGLEEDLAAELERWRQSALDAGVEKVNSEVLRDVGVAHALLDFAAKTGCDALVIGTHGRHGLRRLVLGSVAEHVVRNAPIPVIVVHVPATRVAPAPAGAPHAP